MSPELTLSIIALVVSVATLAWSVHTSDREDFRVRSSQNLAILAEVKLRLGDIPSAFRFHGITEADMKAAEIKPQELAYLTANFIAGQIFYELHDNDARVHDPGEADGHNWFPEDDYRWQLCASPDTQRAWRLIKRLLDKSRYRDRVERTIQKCSRTTSTTSGA